MDKAVLIDLTGDIVAAFVSHNAIQAVNLPGLIAGVHGALKQIVEGTPKTDDASAKPTTAEIRKSITPDYLVSFEDGRRYKSLRRHLTARGLTPEAYCAKYGLPAGYPMASPNYSKQRSALAHKIGLGRINKTPKPRLTAVA